MPIYLMLAMTVVATLGMTGVGFGEDDKPPAVQNAAALNEERDPQALSFSGIESILSKVQHDIATAKHGYQREAQRRHALEAEVKRFQQLQERVQQESDALKRHQEFLETQVHDLEQQASSAHADAAASQQALADLRAQLATWRAEKQQLIAAVVNGEKQVHDLDRRHASELRAAAQTIHAMESQIQAMEGQLQQVQQHHTELLQQHARLQASMEDLHRQTEEAEAQSLAHENALRDASARFAALSEEKDMALAAARDAEARTGVLVGQLAAEQAAVLALKDEKLKVEAMLRMVQAEDQAKFDKQAGQLEAEQSHRQDLAAHLSERDQEVGDLRQHRTALMDRVTALEAHLAEANARAADVSRELTAAAERAILAEEERDQLASHVHEQRLLLGEAEQKLARAGQQNILYAAQRREDDGARAQAEQQLTRLKDRLAGALEVNMSHGDVAVQQLDDRVKIILLDRILFYPGQPRLKQEGLAVLQQLGGLLREVHDLEIRVDGHTDNVPIGQKLRAQFVSNWELSAARATTVVRHLISEAGLLPEQLTAAGYADTRPLYSHDTAAGRDLNRRLEIVLIPKNATVVVSHIQP